MGSYELVRMTRSTLELGCLVRHFLRPPLVEVMMCETFTETLTGAMYLPLRQRDLDWVFSMSTYPLVPPLGLALLKCRISATLTPMVCANPSQVSIRDWKICWKLYRNLPILRRGRVDMNQVRQAACSPPLYPYGQCCPTHACRTTVCWSHSSNSTGRLPWSGRHATGTLPEE